MVTQHFPLNHTSSQRGLSYTVCVHMPIHRVPAQRSVHSAVPNSSQRGLLCYILYAITLLRLIHGGSRCHGSIRLLQSLIHSVSRGHTLLYTGRPIESSVVSRHTISAPTQIRLDSLMCSQSQRGLSYDHGRQHAHAK